MTEEEHRSALAAMYEDWQQGRARREMAQQALVGAQADELAKEARFKGAAELVHGKDATFEYSEKTGLEFIQPNRETRRALAKARKKR